MATRDSITNIYEGKVARIVETKDRNIVFLGDYTLPNRDLNLQNILSEKFIFTKKPSDG